MINRNGMSVGILRNALTAMGARDFGRQRLLALENFIYGSTTHVKVGSVSCSFSTKDPSTREYFRGYRETHRGYSESGVLNYLLGALDPGMCFYDVGAFCGLYSVLAAKKVGDTGTVHAFELIEDNFVQLHRNIRLNRLSNVQTHLCAVQHCTDLVAFTQHGLQSDSAHSIIDIRGHLLDTRQTVNAIALGMSLDDFSRASGSKPDVMKIDVEGAEMRVLNGATQSLLSSKLVFCELHPKALKADGSSTRDVLACLSSAGFSLFKVEGFRSDIEMTIVPIEPQTEIVRNSMILANRPDHQTQSL